MYMYIIVAIIAGNKVLVSAHIKTKRNTISVAWEEKMSFLHLSNGKSRLDAMKNNLQNATIIGRVNCIYKSIEFKFHPE